MVRSSRAGRYTADAKFCMNVLLQGQDKICLGRGATCFICGYAPFTAGHRNTHLEAVWAPCSVWLAEARSSAGDPDILNNNNNDDSRMRESRPADASTCGGPDIYSSHRLTTPLP